MCAHRVRLVDTSIRDGVQSLWAINLRTADMAPILPDLDNAGFDQIELMAPSAAFKKFVRDLHENPWDWIHEAARAVRHTDLRWHGKYSGRGTSGNMPREVGLLMIRRVVELGIRHIRIGNQWNQMEKVATQKAELEAEGMQSIVNIVYSDSPRHTDEYFVRRVEQAMEFSPYRLCLKDVCGLLRPERARTLFPKLVAASSGTPWEFHGHCVNGLAPLNALEAAAAGVSYIHSAVPPLANGNSLPSSPTLHENLRLLDYDVDLDVDRLGAVSDHLSAVAAKEAFPIGAPHEYKVAQYHHQVPGGMQSNLEFQLKVAGLEDRLDEVLAETAQVRHDFGYPIMISPISQYVAGQAVLNVLAGARYERVTDDSIEYALGRHGGDEALDAMEPEVRAKILDRPRAAEVKQHLDEYHEREPTLRDLRKKYGPRVSDEDLILMAIVGDDALDAIGPARTGPPVRTDGHYVLDIVRHAVANGKAASFTFTGPDTYIRMSS